MQELHQIVVNHKVEAAVAVAKTAPPVAVTGMILFGHPMQEWVCILTCIWIIMQMYLALYHHYNKSVNSNK